MQLHWHRYKYYPYEKELAKREAVALLSPSKLQETNSGIEIQRPENLDQISRLVYFSKAHCEGLDPIPTKQSLLEKINGNGSNRQSTRYSSHGLHEYKGKFNPQVAKALLNIFGAEPGKLILDPFCGSGTSLVECAHLGICGVGTDINPFATYLANTKVEALGVKASVIMRDVETVVKITKKSRRLFGNSDERSEYLKKWFSKDQYLIIERFRSAVLLSEVISSNILLALASNLLRDYSLQEPQDLRIRKRKSPPPTVSFLDAFVLAAKNFCNKLQESQSFIGVIRSNSKAITSDCRVSKINPLLKPNSFDMAITSPPYATALPYIDTQRLSLVWLDMLKASDVSGFESKLVGSRETKGQKRSDLVENMTRNTQQLPDQEAAVCLSLMNALESTDGFRRQAVPLLLYRYFVGMAESFAQIHKLMKPNASFGLIVGGNHTVLGGKRFDIDTANHLASIASATGWQHLETVPLQTYQRFGLHMNNATSSEALVLLRA